MSTAQFSTKGFERTPTAATGVVLIVVFAAVMALLGGSSRFDAVQLAALRPLAALFLVPAIYWISSDKLVPARAPLAILGLMALWTALQIVPLPTGLWQALPGRDAIVAIDAIHGLSENWRPISWVPMRTWNALFALVVPLAAILLALAVRARQRTLLLAIVGIGVVDALLGLAQIAGGPESLLYFYTHTNAGAPVGLFANENHSGVFSALILLVIARQGCGQGQRVQRIEVIALAVAYALVSLALLGSGSRAALGAGIIALVASAYMAWLRLRKSALETGSRNYMALIARNPVRLLLAGIVPLGGMIFVLFQHDRAPGLTSAMSQNAFEDLRWQIAPILWEMIATNWLLGTGFGSFDAVYLTYEPTAFQGQLYVNQAHNDWAQFVIEGGLPAILLLIAFARWFFSALRNFYAASPKAIVRGMFWAMTIVVLAGASLVDYPLRTPIFQAVCGFLVVVLVLDMRSAGRRDRA